MNIHSSHKLMKILVFINLKNLLMKDYKHIQIKLKKILSKSKKYMKENKDIMNHLNLKLIIIKIKYF
jgi:hypothetical protein